MIKERLGTHRASALLMLCLVQVNLAPAQNRTADLPTSQLLSQPGPSFTIKAADLGSPVSVITYGDMRFTDPKNVTSTDPYIRKWLVQKIAKRNRLRSC